jgi:outer membrane lipoprotein-sorting protein
LRARIALDMLRRILNGGKMAGKTGFRKSNFGGVALFTAVISLSFTGSQSAAEAAKAILPKSAPAAESLPVIHAVDASETAKLKKLSAKYSGASALTMKVNKTLKLGVLEEERKSKGQLWIAGGQLRMELDGAEHFLLVVNKKNLYAVTFPAKEFKTAAVQVIRGETQSKKAKAQALTSLLGASGFLKAFKPTGLNILATGERVYFLMPVKDQSEFKRAEIKVSSDGGKIQEFKYWDNADNETTMDFSDVAFGGKIDAKLFNYTPPANADVMNL